MTPKIETVSVRGTHVHMRCAGEGRPLLFLHGAGGVFDWTPFFDQLATRAQVWVPDHPGFGQSDDPSLIKSMPDLAMFYLDLMDLLAPEQGFDVVGHSIGGWLAAEIAVRNCTHINSLTLMNAAGLRVKGVSMGDVFIWNEEETARKLLHDPVLQEKRLAAQPSAEVAEMQVKNKFSFAKLAWHPRLFNPDLEKWLHRIQVPSHIMWGQHDQLFPPAYAHHWRNQLHSQGFTMLEACAHSPQAEVPLDAANHILQFIEQHVA